MNVWRSRRFLRARRVSWTVEAVTSDQWRFKLCLALAGIMLAALILTMPRSGVAAWLRSRLAPISNAKTSADQHSVDLETKRAGVDRSRRSTSLNFLPPPLLGAPSSLAVPTASSTTISLSWTPPAGTVDHYQIERSQSLSGPFTVIANSATASFTDTTVASVNSYLYRVRAVDSFGAPSPPSNMALGTAITFLDPSLQAGITEIKAQHLTELRQAVNTVRGVAGLSTATWTDTTLGGALIKAIHVQELRDRLGEALTVLSVSSGSYTDPTLATGSNGTLVKKIHIEELRLRATRGSSTSSGPADSGPDSATARLDPMNRTGGGGDDPLSRNYNWSLTLVGLPGRAGLDLGLSLAYNSLATWTKSGSYISFDDDHGSPSPGFRLGFPVIQAAFYNTQAGKYSFLMITPSGARVELRQVGTSNLYQSVDSSYLLLDASTMTLRATDGSQLSYAWKGSDYQCTQIKDRNGNYLTVNYDTNGRIDTVVDTLARTIKFNYGADGLSTITQTWTVNGQATTHTWAFFSYANQTIQTNFSGLTVIGPSNGSTLKLLTQVTLADNSHYNFDYTSWGQVWKISQYTGETSAHLLNYRSYNLPPDNSTAQTDCPRFTVRHDWAEKWNRDTNGTAQEVNTNFIEPYSATIPGTSQTGTLTQVTLPDSTYHKIYFGRAGVSPAWQNGLSLLTETYDAGNTKQRWVTTTWTQDDTNVSYPLNPRATETNIYDPAGNHARTRVDYATFNLPDGTSCRYPQDSYEYQADATTVLRRTHTDYNLAATYTNRRIIGLPSAKYLCDGAQGEVPCNDGSGASLFSKVAFQYDGSGSIQGSEAPVQHDNTNYGANFVAGRANLSSATRYDVTNTSQFTVSTLQYNTAGAVVATHDPLNHGVTISYVDSFSDGIGRNTLAYPTSVTDPDGYSATAQYNFDFGAVTQKQTPQPNTTANLPGPVQTIAYDLLGRTDRVTNLVNNAYTRFVYPASQNRVDTYATIQDYAGEAHSFKITDGYGRVIASAADHPGSTGGFSGQLIYYDTMGRVIKQSNPTETSASSTSGSPYDWPDTGDDSTTNGGFGWVYTQQTYDWKGRPLVTTNTDNTTKSASYGGCGCAGGEVVTLTDEGTIDGGVAKRRQQKIYSDVLGRTVKTDVLNWEGGSVYSTTVNTYSVLDQVTLVRQFQGADTSGTYQDTTMTYDGYGRLLTKHVPEQNAGTATIYAYNTDDSVQSVTDARGASATYSYNGRHLVTGISYSAPAGITPTSNVTFGYDAAGNRTSMTDGLGSVSYAYNDLSRMTSETRSFTSVGTFALSYDYNLAGELKKITDSTNMTINYGYDSSGRLNGVTGSDNLVGGVSNYASGFAYRAWGGLKTMTDGTSHTCSLLYNSRLQPTHFDISGGVANQNYDYYNNGRLSFVHNTTDINFDRSFTFDHAGRLTAAATGGEARHDTGPVPMFETFQYNVWDNTTSRFNESWLNDFYDSASYTNGRRAGWTYDADGRVSTIDTRSYSYDAAAKTRSLTGQRWTPSGTYVPTSTSIDFDGDGNKVRETSDSSGSVTTTYYLRSTVLRGEIIEELNSSGQKQLGYVFTPAGGLIARQVPGLNYVMLKQMSPIGASQYQFFQSDTGTGLNTRQEFDPAGANIRLNSGPVGHGGAAGDIPSGGGGSMDSRFGAIENPAAGCMELLDGVPTPCSWINRMGQSGALQLKVGNTRYDIQMLGDSTAWVDAWEEYFIPGRGFIGFDANGAEQYDAGTTGIRNVGYFVTIPGGGVPLLGAINTPQEPAYRVEKAYGLVDINYNKCAEALAKTGIGSGYVPSGDVAKATLYASIVEGADATLIAVTWAAEAVPPFNFNPVSNPRQDGGADVGPMGTATTIWTAERFTHGLADPFGTTRTKFEKFNGDSYDNLRLGARALNDVAQRTSSRADTAGQYRAGSRTGFGYNDRVGQFNRWSGPYDDFFNCLQTAKK
jgi:YD repeat-containing protein